MNELINTRTNDKKVIIHFSWKHVNLVCSKTIFLKIVAQEEIELGVQNGPK